MTLNIKDMDELKDLLGKAYWIETEMEGAIEWKFLLSYQPEHRELIYKMSHESAGHRAMLKRMCANIKDLDIVKASKGDLGLVFNFKNKLVEEILSEIMKYDKLALEVYKRLYDHTDKEFLSSIWKGKDPEEYFQTILKIMNEEIGHIELLFPHTGKIERI